MKTLFVSNITALLLGSLIPSAQTWACDSTYARLIVSIEQSQLKIDDTKDSTELESISKSAKMRIGQSVGDDREMFFSAHGGKTATLGLYTSLDPIKTKVKVSLDKQIDKEGGLCISIGSINLIYDFGNPIMYIAKDQKSPCKKQVSYDHELTHHKNHEYAVSLASEELKQWAQNTRWPAERITSPTDAQNFNSKKMSEIASQSAKHFLDRVADIRKPLDQRLDNSARSIEESLFCAQELPENEILWLRSQQRK